MRPEAIFPLGASRLVAAASPCNFPPPNEKITSGTQGTWETEKTQISNYCLCLPTFDFTIAYEIF